MIEMMMEMEINDDGTTTDYLVGSSLFLFPITQSRRSLGLDVHSAGGPW